MTEPSSGADQDYLCCDIESEARELSERLYQLARRINPIDGGDVHTSFDAGVLCAIRTTLEASFVCERHRKEDDDRRLTERLLDAIKPDPALPQIPAEETR